MQDWAYKKSSSVVVELTFLVNQNHFRLFYVKEVGLLQSGKALIMQQKFQAGDMIIYRKTKHGVQPGPRATNVHPAAHGDTYNYTVDKFWIVQGMADNGMLIAKTRRGKLNYLKADDPNLQKANWLQRLWHRARFSALSLPSQTNAEETSGSLATR